jgi:hypothetical protein
MRDYKGMKRQRGRNRGSGGGNKGQQHNANRAFDSNGPEGIKVRGNAQHVYDKYQQLARDASGAGDRILAENYLQHAEHYFRLIRATQPNRAVTDIVGRDTFSSGYDIDFEDENAQRQQALADQQGGSEPQSGSDQQGGQDSGDNQSRAQDNQNRGQDVQNAADRDGERNGRNRPRRNRNRDDDYNRQDNRQDARQDNRQDNRARGGGDNDGDPLKVVEPKATPLPETDERDKADEDGPRLRSRDGDESHAPAFLKAPSAARSAAAKPSGDGDDDGEDKPRRRRQKTPAQAD